AEKLFLAQGPSRCLQECSRAWPAPTRLCASSQAHRQNGTAEERATPASEAVASAQAPRCPQSSRRLAFLGPKAKPLSARMFAGMARSYSALREITSSPPERPQ